jgi:serine/threonine-protein kinase
MRIEGYEIGEVVSRGKIARVYRARQLSLDRLVAIKVLEPVAAADPATREAFEAECRRLAGLLHPNLVSGLAWGEVEGRPYLVIEQAEGRRLETRVKRDGAFPEQAGLDVAHKVARGLAYLEGEGLVHGDPAPSSILVTAGDAVKIGRMNLTRPIGWDGRDRHGRPAGTVGFMSPEQATGSGPMDPRSNVFTLGAVLYFVLCGRTPLEDAAAEVVDGRVVERPPPLGARRRDLGRATLDLVGRFMEPDPDDRPGSVPEAVEAIEAVREEAEQRLRLKTPRGAAQRARVKRKLRSRAQVRSRSRRRPRG